jgi:hypothetical protein
LVFADSTPAVPDTFTYRRKASGRISTEKHVAKIESVGSQAATVNVNSTGKNFVQVIPGPDPGGLGSTAKDNSYNCDGNSRIQSLGRRRQAPDLSHQAQAPEVTTAGSASEN